MGKPALAPCKMFSRNDESAIVFAIFRPYLLIDEPHSYIHTESCLLGSDDKSMQDGYWCSEITWKLQIYS